MSVYLQTLTHMLTNVTTTIIVCVLYSKMLFGSEGLVLGYCGLILQGRNYFNLELMVLRAYASIFG